MSKTVIAAIDQPTEGQSRQAVLTAQERLRAELDAGKVEGAALVWVGQDVLGQTTTMVLGTNIQVARMIYNIAAEGFGCDCKPGAPPCPAEFLRDQIMGICTLALQAEAAKRKPPNGVVN